MVDPSPKPETPNPKPSGPHLAEVRSNVMVLDTAKSTVQASVRGHASVSDLLGGSLGWK